MDATTLSHTIHLDGETDWPGFRQHARALLAQGVEPDEVTWQTRGQTHADLFAGADVGLVADTSAPGSTRTVSTAVPRSFLEVCEKAVLHRDPARFALLYRLLWRLAHEPALRNDVLDPDRLKADLMAKAVRRDLHKMTAFVRFRPVADAEGGNAEALHVAWFEPEHHIVDAVSPFFMRRFAGMRWAIFTPERSVRWDGQALSFGPGGRRGEAPAADAGEALWLTYYRHIFNPARLKLAMMQKEMPRKYWHNLPEAELIAPLAAQAMARTGKMVDAPATTPRRRIPIAPAPAADSTSWPDDPAQALSALHAATDRCRECPIGAQATQSVFGEGPLGAALMVVGEQPGDQEDLQGRPFVGPAGQLFDRAMADLGWSRERVYVTNAVKHFKYELRGQRRIHKTPTQHEAAACLHWLQGEIEQVAPQAFIALGATAARALLGRHVAVLSERGRWHHDVHGRPVLVTLHPSALLRGDRARFEDAYADWLEDLRLAAHHLPHAPSVSEP